jgi:hypothetical protein
MSKLVEASHVIVVMMRETEGVYVRRRSFGQLLFEFRARIENDSTLLGFDEQSGSTSLGAFRTIPTLTERRRNADGFARTE